MVYRPSEGQLAVLVEDITDRKQAEEALHEEIAERKNREKEQEKSNRTLRALKKAIRL